LGFGGPQQTSREDDKRVDLDELKAEDEQVQKLVEETTSQIKE
jgi:hypothetical protein